MEKKWRTEIIDLDIKGFYNSKGASIAIDSNGYPHISYVDRSNLDLKYAKKIQYNPEKPKKPNGRFFSIKGKEYSYETTANDFDGDKIRYGWDWNEDNIVDEWTEFYNSGKKIEIVHSWAKFGIYRIKVIAEDKNGYLSNWSDEKEFMFFHLCKF